MPRSDILKDFFIYEVDVASIAPAASTTATFNVQADSDFRWEKAVYWAHNTAAVTGLNDSTRVLPLVTVTITDTGSGRQLSSGAIPISNLFGTGEIPFILQQPKIFSARATVSLTFTNFDTAITYALKLSFIGTKLFTL